MIARILHGGMVAQQGLLHVGDIIKEVNGQPVGSDPRALQELLRSASGSVILKILPSYQEPHLPRQVGPSQAPTPFAQDTGQLNLLDAGSPSLQTHEAITVSKHWELLPMHKGSIRTKPGSSLYYCHPGCFCIWVCGCAQCPAEGAWVLCSLSLKVLQSCQTLLSQVGRVQNDLPIQVVCLW